MWRLLRVLLFFPSVTFSLLDAEIFPWAFLAVCYYTITASAVSTAPLSTNFYKKVFPLVFLFAVSLYYSLFYSLFKGVESDIPRSLGAYLNPLAIFLFLLQCPAGEITRFNRLIQILFFILIMLGIFQMLGVIGFLEPVFKILIPRGNAAVAGIKGGRGIRLLSSEPARAAYELFYIYIAWVYLKAYSGIKQFLLDMLMFLFFVFAIRSVTGIAVFFMYLVLKYKIKLFLLIFPVLVLGFPFILNYIENANNRTMQVLYHLISTSTPDQIYQYLLTASGDRFVSMFSSYKYAITHPFGGGVGLWMYSSLDALNSINIDSSAVAYFANKGNGEYFSVRPTSYMANVALDFGLIGVLSVLYMLKPVLALLRSYKRPIFPVTVCFLFGIMASGAAGNPVPWISMALIYRKFISKTVQY